MKLTMAGPDQRKTRRQSHANCWASSGPSASSGGSGGLQATNSSMTDRKNKAKNFPNKEKAKTDQPMNSAIQFEDRVSRSRSKHEGESSADICDKAQPDSRE